jgi:predicted dehydrogenase
MTYRVGVVGSGFGGAVHAPGYQLHPEFELLALASPNRAAEVAKERGIPHAFPSIDAMLEAVGDRLDLISIASPPAEHHGHALAAIAARKHVVCEKPFALSVAQAEEMVGAAERVGVFGAIVFEFRYAAPIRTMRRLIIEGALGPVRDFAIAHYGTGLRRAARRPQSTWWYDGAQGGGIANGFMPHLFDLAFFMTGRSPLRTQGFVRVANPERTDPSGLVFRNTASDGAFALLDVGDGCVVRLIADGTASVEESGVRIVGEGAIAGARGPSLYEMEVTLRDDQRSQRLTLDPAVGPQLEGVRPNLEAFVQLLDDLAAALGGRPHRCPTFADGLLVQRSMAAIGYGT